VEPSLSVVIPTHARETRLAFALDSLAEQTAGHDQFEVLVVRAPASSPPFTGAPTSLNVRFLTAAKRGPAAQRNVGWKDARSLMVAFIDDDCRVAHDWVERLLASVEREAADNNTIIQGRTEPDPDERHLLFGLARTIEVTSASGLYETCNIVYPKRLLELLGGFDESFGYPWAEDTDLGLRAEAIGARLAFAGEAVAWHAVHPNPLPAAIRSAARKRDFPKLVARHPRLRRSMPAGVFVNVGHRDVAFAAAGLVAGSVFHRRRQLLIGLGCVPYLRRVSRESISSSGYEPRQIARFLAHLPVRAAVDVAETSCTISGAIDNRTVVV
jgi:GT2 family glycosyltransferase